MIDLSGLRRLVLPAIVVFFIALLARLPASAVLGWALPEQVATRGISGTIWNGTIDVVDVNGVSIGPVSWRWRPSALLSGRIGATVEAGLPGGYFDGVVGLGSGVIVLEDVRALANLESLTQRSSIGAAGGTARLTATRLRIESLWPADIEGEVLLTRLRYAATGNAALGGYRLRFDGSVTDDPAFPISGVLESDGSAPFSVNGTLALGPGRAYALNAIVAPDPDAPDEIKQALQFLPADPSGQRQLSFEGAL
ncbi:MAG: type II secretion system protein N [Pseudomonadota bacterium]